MTLTIHSDVDQGTEAWFELRRGIVTASVVGNLVTPKTVKPASNDVSRALTAKLVAERITGQSEFVYPNDDMRRGTMAEPYARDIYAEYQSVEVEQIAFMVLETSTYRLGYSPDGLVAEDGLIEIKAPRAKTHLTTLLADEVPLYNLAQCQAGLLVSGRKWLDFISYHGGMPLFVKRVYPDQAWFNAITSAVEIFEGEAERMIANYAAAIEGRPTTEYIDFDMEMSL